MLGLLPALLLLVISFIPIFILLIIGKLLGDRAGRLFSWPAKSASRLVVAYCCLALPVYASAPLITWTSLKASEYAPINTSSVFVFFLLLTLPIIFAVLGGIAMARMLLRIWPVKQESGPSKKAWAMWIGVSGLFILTAAMFIKMLLQARDSRAFYTLVLTSSLVLSVYTLSCVAWSVYFSISVRHASLANRPFVLFLRRFSTFSDHTIVAEVLASTPDLIPAMFIASPQDRAANWDPFVWAFSGIRIRHPFRNIPIQLQTRDENWHETVEILIKKASCIVIDITESSESVEDELRMIGTHAMPERVVCVIDEGRSNDGISRGAEQLPAPIGYRPSYWRAIPRIYMTSIFILFSGASAFGLSSEEWLKTDPARLLIAFTIVAAIMLLPSGASIMRPSISRKVSKQLRQAIRSATHTK